MHYITSSSFIEEYSLSKFSSILKIEVSSTQSNGVFSTIFQNNLIVKGLVAQPSVVIFCCVDQLFLCQFVAMIINKHFNPNLKLLLDL